MNLIGFIFWQCVKTMLYPTNSKLVVPLRVFYDVQGCDSFTFSPAVAEQLVAVPETLAAAAEFEAAAAARNAAQQMRP